MKNRVNEIILASLVVALAGIVIPQKALSDGYRTYTVKKTTVTKTIEKPVYVQRVVTRPVVVERQRVVVRPAVRTHTTGLIPKVYRIVFGGTRYR